MLCLQLCRPVALHLPTLSSWMQTFEDSTKPVIKHFEAMGKLHTVDAAAEISDVYQATRQHFINLLERD